METQMEGSGKNRRALYFKIKVVLAFLAVILVIAYVQSNDNMLHRWGLLESQSVHTIKDSIRRFPERTGLDQHSLSQQNKWGQPASNNFPEKDSNRIDNINKDREVSDDISKEEDSFSKDKADELRQQTYSTKLTNTDTGESTVKNVSTIGSTGLVNETSVPLTPGSLGNTTANGSSTIPSNKITFKTIANIAREILDRLNISHLNTTKLKSNETNKLSHTAVGNISKEIRRQNISRTIARAVIMILSKGNGEGHNYTLGKKLWKEYMNNDEQFRLPENHHGSERTRYMDQRRDIVYRADRGHPQPQYRDDQSRYRDNLKHDGQLPRYRDDQSRYRDNLKHDGQPPRYRDDQSRYRDTLKHDGQPPRYRDDQSRYRDNLKHDGQPPRYRDDQSRYRDNLKHDGQTGRYRERQRPQYRDDRYSSRNRDDRNVQRDY